MSDNYTIPIPMDSHSSFLIVGGYFDQYAILTLYKFGNDWKLHGTDAAGLFFLDNGVLKARSAYTIVHVMY